MSSLTPRAALSFLALLLMTSACTAQVNLADVIERCEKSVVRIEVKQRDGESLGSGFVVAPRTICTNVHVLMGAREAVASFPDGKKFNVSGTVFLDPSRDIAIAKIEGDGVDGLPILQLSKTAVRKGETVVALGSPLGLAFTATSGVVSAMRGGAEITRELGSESIGGGAHSGNWIQLDAALSPGNSGGPVVNTAGDVVAMSTLASKGAQNLNFGISCQDISQALTTISGGAELKSLANGVGAMKPKRSKGGPAPEGRDSVVEPKEIPNDAIAAYVTTGKSEFRSLKRDLVKEIERLRSMLKEMRGGEASIPPSVNSEADVIRTPGKRGGYAWYFRSESVKRTVVGSLETQMKDLNKISMSTGDAKDNNALLTLLSKYGPAVDTRRAGSVGFLQSATVLHAFNDHEALVLIEDSPYVMIMQSTAGLSRGEEIIPTPVFVAGTTTARLPDGRTSALTILQSVTHEELRGSIFGKAAGAGGTSNSSVASAPAGAGSTGAGAGPTASGSGARMWYDKSGSFSVEAVLLEVTDKEVVLRKADGKKVRVPRANLSEADQRYLRQ